MDIHNTAIKKNAGDILETNSLNPVNFSTSSVITPTVAIEYETDVFINLETNGNMTKVLTSNDHIFLTNIYLTSQCTIGGGGSASVEIPTLQGNQTFWIVNGTGTAEASNNTGTIALPGRGIRVLPGGTITLTNYGLSEVRVSLIGYRGSDRSWI